MLKLPSLNESKKSTCFISSTKISSSDKLLNNKTDFHSNSKGNFYLSNRKFDQVAKRKQVSDFNPISKFSLNSSSSILSSQEIKKEKSIDFNSNSKLSLKSKQLPKKDPIIQLLDEKLEHEDKIRSLKYETSKTIFEMSKKYHPTAKEIKISLINKKITTNKLSSDIQKIIYSMPPETIETPEKLKTKIKTTRTNDPLAKAKGFTKKHLFDIFLDKSSPPTKTEHLPMIINLFNKANELKLIEKSNPTTASSFKKIISGNLMKKTFPVENFNYDSLIFDDIKNKKILV
jgi:hypothetical protein